MKRLAMLLSTALLAVNAHAAPFTFAAIGDMPYKTPQAYAGFEAVISTLNRQSLAFTVHIGDIKSGGSPCSNDNLLKIRDYFNTFTAPLIYTPGDNEWTDCHREKAGRYDPLERLDYLRQTFFAKPESLGQQKLALKRQAAEPAFKQYVENAAWQRDGVHFATLHVVGSNNNLGRELAAAREYFERNTANLAWLDKVFGDALAADARAVVLFMQADPNFQEVRWDDQRSGFAELIHAFRQQAKRFKRPILLVHGDSHIFRIDQPLQDEQEHALSHFTRLEVYGEADLHAVLVTVDPSDGVNPFSFKPLRVKENLIGQ